ncbi:hypothetical protein [Scleromatobacter humisilvae]|uniref:Transmembrane protein n=1 Tax=Scleromatobacter humisilvae TaxID=2897159 RepID=A0A9X2C247_9BURK|nr:hypothetical protein [Scleromatobacter humisilvae]MCK9688892.1 hypothetical protein [Scleromatobacter humisilvae]
MTGPPHPVWTALKTVGRGAVALLILFEQWGWLPLARALGQLARWSVVARLERRIAALGPRVALAVLFVPALALLPIKLAALWFVALGRVALGLAVLVVAKLLGTALVARLYLLTQPQLMRLGWFARMHGRWIAWKTRIVASLVESPGWVAARAWALRVRARWPSR